MASEKASATQQLARHIVGTNYDNLPSHVIETAKWFLLDTFGTAWAGTNAPGAEELRRTVLAEDSSGGATVLASGNRLSPSSAALLNGMYAGALDFDGVYEKGSVHPDIVTLPAALAIAEVQQASGRDFLAALAIGNDIACRSGGAMKGNRGWFNTATHGVFGAAAAAAKLLGLDEDATAHALGLAFAQAAGTQQAMAEKSVVKRMLSGMAARAGVFAALAAQNGITAPPRRVRGQVRLLCTIRRGRADSTARRDRRNLLDDRDGHEKVSKLHGQPCRHRGCPDAGRKARPNGRRHRGDQRYHFAVHGRPCRRAVRSNNQPAGCRAILHSIFDSLRDRTASAGHRRNPRRGDWRSGDQCACEES